VVVRTFILRRRTNMDKELILNILIAFGKEELGVEVPRDWDEIESMVLSDDEMEDFSTNEEVLRDGGIVYTYVADEPDGYDCSININVITNNDGIPVDVSVDTEDGDVELGFDASKYIGEDISAIQSEMAKGYSDYIRRTAPWIIGED
jgi:hypothetical protein